MLVTHRARLDVWFTLFALLVTLAAGGIFYAQLIPVVQDHVVSRSYSQATTAILLGLVLFALLWGNLIYFLVRVGWLRREGMHAPLERQQLWQLHASTLPSLTILVPSYKEDESVVSRALISAALMEYPQKHVVLLIDDCPFPSSESDFLSLEHSRKLAEKIGSRLQAPHAKLQSELQSALVRRERKDWDLHAEAEHLAALYIYAADFFEKWGKNWAVRSHVDEFFVRRVFGEPAAHYRKRARELGTVRQAKDLDGTQLLAETRSLVSVFDAQLSTFERKRFVNLSHEANKAMNLNTYLGLMGKPWKVRDKQDGSYLEEAAEGDADFCVPASKYVVTLDADSVLLNDYALRLVAVMEERGNERVAVAQTPYSAFPGAPNILERVAGATTDIQYYVHQGFSHFEGAFWVGANALIRREAMEDIAERKTERGFPITVYIQNRTVIEDTESSVDLVRKDWRLYNYFDRLAYSETPSDFGSLLIQRRRWANGGLIILPKLLRYCASGKCGLGESVTRLHYLVSPTITNVALLLLMLLPFDERLASVALPVAAISYFWLYGRDLVRAGYRWLDVPRVYALNLLLVPVNLGGVLKSLHQAITGRSTPFGRTPKISTRTAAPPIYVLSILAILAIAAVNALSGAAYGYWTRFGFSLLNCVVLSYVVFRYIGITGVLEDLRISPSKIDTSPAIPIPVMQEPLRSAETASRRAN